MENKWGDLKIEKGVPIPASRSGTMTALFQAMKKGDSVFLPDTQVKKAQSIVRYALGKGNYVCRTQEGGTRVWRTK